MYFEGSESFGVRSSDNPTVPNAEKHSKMILSIPYFPSKAKIPKEPRTIVKIDIVIIANALLTEYS
jgi:hypothetical protein